MGEQRTLGQLEALFIDNNDGDISASDGRDLVATTFGYPASVDPTPDNDAVDSAGIGQFFDVGSKWLNTTTQVRWTCWSGTTHMAVWQPDYNGAPTPAAGSFPAKLTNHPGVATPLTLNLASASITSGGNVVVIGDPGAAAQVELGNLWQSGTGGVPSGRIVAIDTALNTITVEAMFSVTTTLTTSSIVPYAWEWQEATTDPATGALVPLAGGRSGSYTVNPLLNLRIPLVDEVGGDVMISLRGNFGGTDVYQMDLLPDPTGSLNIGDANQTSPTTINYAGNSSFPTTITFGDNVILSVVFSSTTINFFVGTTINPVLIPPSGSEFRLIATGTNQAGANTLQGTSNRVTTVVPGSQEGVILPAITAAVISVINDAFSGGTVRVYPPSGEYFNGFGLNVAITLSGGQATQFIRLPVDAGGQSEWRRIQEL